LRCKETEKPEDSLTAILRGATRGASPAPHRRRPLPSGDQGRWSKLHIERAIGKRQCTNIGLKHLVQTALAAQGYRLWR
jgi:hypothetical protein